MKLTSVVKLLVALLKQQLKNVLGDDGMSVLTQELAGLGGDVLNERMDALLGQSESQAQLLKAAQAAEDCFRRECQDADLRAGIRDLPLDDLPTVQAAIAALPTALDDSGLTSALSEALRRDFPSVSASRVNAAVAIYTRCMRHALLMLPEFAPLITGQATMRTEQKVDQVLAILAEQSTHDVSTTSFARPGSAPPLPTLIIGREEALYDLKVRLGITVSGHMPAPMQVLTAVRGWPGVGKTTLAAALAHDPDVAIAFPDGVLWISLGPTPSLLSELATWGRALGIDDILRARTLEEASAQLTAHLRNKRMLLIVDDVWEPEHVIPFKVGGRGCAMLITTRISSVAHALAPTPKDIYKLPVLTDEKGLELLQALAPNVVAQYPQQSLELVRELEGLPLALQVAGHLLNVEASYSFSVTDLLTELREGARLLEAKAPADRVDLANETTPTVAVLLQKSTDHLDTQTRDCFAYLGVFAPKPATFDLTAMKVVWQIEDPKPIARQLVDRGLLEPVGSGRFQMHALLVMHAKSLLTE